MRLLALVFASLIGLSATAHAGILLEPYLGYGMTTSKDSTGAKDKINAPAIGARVGGEFAMLFVAADASQTLGAKGKPDDGTPSYDVTVTNVYGVVGANLPVVRVWGGYGLMNEAKVKSPDAKLHGGTHYKLGVGFKVIPMLSLNAEYVGGNFKKLDVAGLKTSTDVDFNGFFISASVPFSF